MKKFNKNEARQRIKKLKKEIEHHRYLYHVLDKIEISDSALDSLKHELQILEDSFPEFKDSNSPTQRIGGAPLKQFKKIRHTVQQWSFNDAFNEQEAQEFDQRVRKLLGAKDRENIFYSCELKIDGLHIVLTYKNGELRHGATRGDGKVGEDVTHNLRTIQSLPLILREPIDVVVEGEVYLPRSVFEALNKKRAQKGEPLFSNPRNAAAGAVRQLDSKVAAERQLDCFVYDLSEGLNLPRTQTEELQRLKKLGFKVNNHYKSCKNIEEVIAYWRQWEKKKDKEDYWIDGVVVKLEERSGQEQLGYTGKAPRWAIALKFTAEQATTIVEDIVVQVGRTGVLTPVAHLRPVQIAGSVVSRATLHNEDEIKRLNIKIGDTVIIQKAGDVIPDIVKVLVALRNGQEKVFTMPDKCPICGSAVKKRQGGTKDTVARYCTNSDCYAQSLRRNIHFASKQGIDVEGLGKKIVEKLMQENLVSDPADFFTLKQEDIASLEGFADVSAKKLVTAIQGRCRIPLARFLNALGIRHVGEGTAILLAERFGSLKNLSKLTAEEINSVPDIGPIVARSMVEWFQKKSNQELLAKFNRVGVVIKNQKQSVGGRALAGKTFVFTGSLHSFSRDEAKNNIRKLGGRITESVSQETSYVVKGDNPGSKAEQAKKLGVKIINEREFLSLLEQS